MESGTHFDASRAELFEALGHPTRVKILRTLETKPMGFAELKREVGIESSGHLQFHLGKLAGLVTTNAEGSYTLTDDGREAIRVLKAIPTGSEQIPTVSTVSHRRDDWLKPLVAVLLITIVVLAGVAIYQQEQIASLNHALSPTTTIGGTSYYYESIQPPFNGSSVTFHGVTFNSLQIPVNSYSNPANYTFRGSVLLSNGTLLNLNGKTVMIGEVNVNYALLGSIGVSLTFPDGFQVVHQEVNVTATYQQAHIPPVYDLTYTYLPSITNPWFTQHGNTRAGVFFGTGNYGALWTLYVSE